MAYFMAVREVCFELFSSALLFVAAATHILRLIDRANTAFIRH